MKSVHISSDSILFHSECLDSLPSQASAKWSSAHVDGYDVFFRIRAAAIPIAVATPDFQESLTTSLISALDEAFEKALCPVRALLIANPHNPLGKCYPKSVIEACFQFCQNRDIHFISDEAFALSTIKSLDQPETEPFTSALAINPSDVGCLAWRFHVIWSMSKDFGCSGLKVVRLNLTIQECDTHALNLGLHSHAMQ